ncbi:methyltransferase domain-containing protein [Bacillus sp. BGMRC 2118]|nr:methyltransferase domain-containing protein [Bacillus sp. BGMRC 2118]
MSDIPINKEKYKCPFCKHKFENFIPWPDYYDFPGIQYEMYNKKTAMCPICKSLDRERLFKIYIEQETQLLEKPQSLLHIAPEKNLRNWIRGHRNISYTCGDLFPQDNEMERIDLTEIPYEDNTFDVILCSHVLEHIIDDQKAMKELYRVLRPGGWSILQVPIALNIESIVEDNSITTPEGRKRHFGQDDHVRLYNRDGFINRLRLSGFIIHLFNLAEKIGLVETKSYGLSKGDYLYIVTK